MGEDGVPPGSIPPPSVPPPGVSPVDGPPTEPIPAMTWLLRDWWDPAWDAEWWGPVREATPATGAGAAAAPPAAVLARPAIPPRGAVRPAPAPSWGRVLATTVSLSVSRRLTRLRGSRARLVAAAMLGAGLLATAAGAAGLVVAGHSLTAATRPAARPSSVPVPPGRAVTPVWLATVQQTARPVWLTIPAIGVRAPVEELGLNPDGTLQVPASTTVTGWYTDSPRPGAIGSAVIVGHVDSRAGPAVFFWLRTMRPGDRVYVRRADGSLAVFTVTNVRMYAKNHFPTAAVYGPVPDAELRLITCGGIFDRSLGSYLSNVVVYARLTG
jgi:sortase (surface protein transpeptidase)